MSAVRRNRPGASSPLAPEIERLHVGGEPEIPKSRTPEVPESVTPEATNSETPEVTESGSPEVPELRSDVPRYRQLDRVDARLRADQIEALTELRKRIMRQRARKEERITDNTLIRVAVDLLLSRAGSLRGDTEEELRTAALKRGGRARPPAS